jgi:hypothetical protein
MSATRERRAGWHPGGRQNALVLAGLTLPLLIALLVRPRLLADWLSSVLADRSRVRSP